MKTKEIQDNTKQCKQNGTFQNNERKFYQQVVRKGAKTYQQPNATSSKKRFGSKYGNRGIIKDKLNSKELGK